MPSPENSKMMSGNLLIFYVGNIRCAVPVTDLDNVIRMAEITPEGDISALNKGIAGSLVFHGEVIPVYSPSVFFGERMPEPALTDNLILVSPGGRSSALWINRVDKVCSSEEIYNPGEDKGEDGEDSEKSFIPEIPAEEFVPKIPGVKMYRHIVKEKESVSPDIPGSGTDVDPVRESINSSEEIILLIYDINSFIAQGLKGGLRHIFGYIRKLAQLQIPEEKSVFLESETEISGTKGITETDEDISAKTLLYSGYVSPDFEQVKNILRERREQIEKPEEKEEESESIEILRFRLMYAEYAVEMKYIREVLINERITPIPGIPDFIMGIFALRGEIISLVNLRVLFRLPKAGITDLNRVIILSNGDITFGVLADYITDIGTIPVNQIKIPDEKTRPIDENYVKGIVDDSLIVLDAEFLLSDPRMVIDEK